MARNERDVELVIKARDEAERALTKITDALLGMSKAQDTVSRSARQSDGALSGLSDELAQLDTRLNALQDLGRVAVSLEKATAKISQMEIEAQQTRNELTRLGTDAQVAAEKVAAAEAKRAETTKRTKEERAALTREVRAAKSEESSIQKAINSANSSLEAQIDRLERASKAYKELEVSAKSAGSALGVDPTRAGVQSAVASTKRQQTDTQELATFRATAAQNEELQKRAAYERAYGDLLDEREEQQRQANATAEAAAAAESRLVQQAERLRGQLNPLAAVQDRYNKELLEAEMLMKSGKITTQEYAQAQTMLKARMEASADAMGQMSQANIKGPLGLRPYELTNLSYQINDIVTGLMSGQPAVQILAQQGGQVFQIFSRQLQAFLPLLAAMAPTLLGIAATFLVVGTAVKRAFEDDGNLRKFNSELARVASGSAYSAEGLQKSAREVRNMGVETDKTREIFSNFIKEGLNPAVFTEFTKTARQFAKVTGQEVPDAAKSMAEAFSGGYEQVKKLDEEFDFLTAAEREHIRVLFESGRAQDARRVAFEAFARRQDEAARKSETVWTKAVKELGQMWRNFIDYLSGTTFVQGIKSLINWLGEVTLEVIRATNYVGGLIAKFTDFLGLSNSTKPISLSPTTPQSGGRAAGGGKIYGGEVTPDIDAIVRTVIGEARRGDVQGMQDVAAVILNRMERSGKSARDVVFQRHQFEPWNNPRTKGMLNAIKPEDESYQTALRAILPILKGEIADPTNGATMFVSPGGQSAMGRRMPVWAKPEKMTAERGGHQFFTGAFPGDRGLKTDARGTLTSTGGSAVTTETEADRKRGQDGVARAEEELRLTRDLTEAEKIRQAGLNAYRQAQNDGFDEASARRMREIAEERVRAEVERDRAARLREIESEQASANREAGRAQETLARQLADIDKQTEAAIEKRRAERARNPAAAGRLKEMEDELRANGEILKQRAELEFREKEINALLEQRDLALKRLKDKYDQSVTAGTADPNKYLADVTAVLDRFNPRLAAMAASAKTFVEGIGSAVPAERTQRFVDQMDQIIGGSTAEQRAAHQVVLNNAEKAYNDILEARNAKLAELQQRLEATNPQEYLKESRAVIEAFAPQLNDATNAAILLAQSIGGAKPSPEMMAFISKARQAGGDSSAQVQANDRAQLVAAEKAYNDILEARNAKLAELQQRLEATNPTEYLRQSREVIEAFAPRLAEATGYAITLAQSIGGAKPSAEMMAFISKANQASNDSKTQIDSNERAKLADADRQLNEALAVRQARLAAINAELEAGRITEAQATEQEIVAYSQTQPLIDQHLASKQAILQTMLSLGLINQQVYDAEIAKLQQITTESARVDQRTLALKKNLEGAFSSSVMNGFDTFAKSLANGKSAIESLGDAMRQFAADFLSQIAKMIMQQIIFNMLQAMGGGAPGGGGGGIFGKIAGFITGGPTKVGKNHNGGMAGTGPSRPVSPAWFANAVRYHGGGIAGLAPDEVPSILKRNEEVLTRDDPRHRLNGGMGGPAAPTPVNIINTFDPGEFMSKALGVAEGEKAILNFMRANSRAVKAALG
jgi:Prophage tail length tape measure protein/Cell Wall Hydrolase